MHQILNQVLDEAYLENSILCGSSTHAVGPQQIRALEIFLKYSEVSMQSDFD